MSMAYWIRYCLFVSSCCLVLWWGSSFSSFIHFLFDCTHKTHPAVFSSLHLLHRVLCVKDEFTLMSSHTTAVLRCVVHPSHHHHHHHLHRPIGAPLAPFFLFSAFRRSGGAQRHSCMTNFIVRLETFAVCIASLIHTHHHNVCCYIHSIIYWEVIRFDCPMCDGATRLTHSSRRWTICLLPLQIDGFLVNLPTFTHFWLARSQCVRW